MSRRSKTRLVLGWGAGVLVAGALHAQTPAAPSARPTPEEIQEYLYRNGARALTVPSPGQPGSEVFSRGAELNTLPATTSTFPAPPAPPAAPSASSKAPSSAAPPSPSAPAEASSASEAPSAAVGAPVSAPSSSPGTPAAADTEVREAPARAAPSETSRTPALQQAAPAEIPPVPAESEPDPSLFPVSPLRVIADFYDGVGTAVRWFLIVMLVAIPTLMVAAVIFAYRRRSGAPR